MHPLLERYFATIRTFLPSEEKTTAVGLDIGTGECKLVELTKSDEAYEIVHWGIEAIQDGDIAAAIQKIFKNLSAPCKSLYTSVFGKGTLIRYIDMPRMSIEDLKSSFDIEADKYFPFAQNQIYTDCFILESKEKEKNMSVMAAAVKREIIDRRIKLLTDLGLPTEFISLNPIVLANTLNVLGDNEQEGKESVSALLDMGESVSTLTILVNKMPWFTRDIFIGGRDFTKGISSALNIGLQEAEKLKLDPGDKKNEVFHACETALMNMVQELRLSIDYFATEKNREIHKLLLTGGASMFTGVMDVFVKNLELKVNMWNPVGLVKASSSVSPEELTKSALKLGVALGLALYQYD